MWLENYKNIHDLSLKTVIRISGEVANVQFLQFFSLKITTLKIFQLFILEFNIVLFCNQGLCLDLCSRITAGELSEPYMVKHIWWRQGKHLAWSTIVWTPFLIIYVCLVRCFFSIIEHTILFFSKKSEKEPSLTVILLLL